MAHNFIESRRQQISLIPPAFNEVMSHPGILLNHADGTIYATASHERSSPDHIGRPSARERLRTDGVTKPCTGANLRATMKAGLARREANAPEIRQNRAPDTGSLSNGQSVSADRGITNPAPEFLTPLKFLRPEVVQS